MASDRAAPPPSCPVMPCDAVPRVSVIIPTYRRRDHLRTVLDQLAAQDTQPIEVVVIDSSPVDERLETAELDSRPLWLQYEGVDASDGNVSSQRNRALVRCTGDFVLFLDDDVLFGRNLITCYMQAFAETGAHAVSGAVLLPGEQLSHAPRQRNRHLIDNAGAPNMQAFDGIVESYVVCSANFCALRQAVIAVGGFDEQLTRLEDVELALRMVKHGYRVMHHHRPLVHHLVAAASGARSAERGIEWMLPSMFYFQLRHFPKRRPILALVTLWEFCRPSRHWFTPRLIMQRARAVLAAYRQAIQRLSAGPRLLT